MTSTPSLALPYLETSQAQKELTHNEALNRLDTLVQATVISATITAPPGSPAIGAAYIVPTGATGAWSGHAGHIAAWFSGWQFHVPETGWAVWNVGTSKSMRFDGTAWQTLPSGRPAEQIPGINAPWINYGGGFQGAHYFISADKKVTIEGLIQAPGGSPVNDVTLFTLLEGYRPAANLMFITWTGGGAGRIDVNADGTVVMRSGNAAFTSLTGISFYAA